MIFADFVMCKSCDGKGIKQLDGYTIPMTCEKCGGQGGIYRAPMEIIPDSNRQERKTNAKD